MQRRMLSRAATAALSVLLLTAVAAQADTVPADGDSVTPGNQGSIDLGQAMPGQTITWPVGFHLTCAGLGHAEPGATITLTQSGSIVPDGGSVSATTTSIGPVPADWTAPGEGCPSPAPTLLSNAPSSVTMTMPAMPGPHDFTVMWSRSGATGLSGSTAITIRVEVVDNAPPQLQLPADIVAEATSPAGATVTWTATATDAEDVPPPTPACSPASGSTFALGLTTVECSVTDSGGATASGSFVVDVRAVASVAWSVRWGEPVATTGAPFVANAGRTIPVKVEIFADGVEQSHGNATLEVMTCGGDAVGALDLGWDGGRWTAHLDTGRLAGPGCYQVVGDPRRRTPRARSRSTFADPSRGPRPALQLEEQGEAIASGPAHEPDLEPPAAQQPRPRHLGASSGRVP